jgi:transcriptional regulator with XRE-family HTH domain
VSTASELSKSLRQALGGLTQAELAARLLVSRNYISQIEADLKEPSKRLRAQMEALLTESAKQPADKVSSQIEENSQAPYGSADALRAEVRRHFEERLAEANDDPVRLGWLLQQMREYLRRPSDWKVESAEERKRRLGLVRRQNPPGAEGQSLPTIPHGKSAQG